MAVYMYIETQVALETRPLTTAHKTGDFTSHEHDS